MQERRTAGGVVDRLRIDRLVELAQCFAGSGIDNGDDPAKWLAVQVYGQNTHLVRGEHEHPDAPGVPPADVANQLDESLVNGFRIVLRLT